MLRHNLTFISKMQALRTCIRVRNLGKIFENKAKITSVGVINAIKNPKLIQNLVKSPQENSDSLRLCSLSTKTPQNDQVDINTFEKACEETLESLTEYFEQIVEEADNLKSADVSYSSGVLTVNLGPQFGTYVINRQSPNRQIWLSSPFSGPKRYDFVPSENCWIYKHDGQSLHDLLQQEVGKIVDFELNFASCLYAKL